MNILVIGNGFDLAHGLPTKYRDFLEFARVIRQVVKIRNEESSKDIDWGEINPKIKKAIIDDETNGKLNSFYGSKQCKNLLKDNIWIDYFLQRNMFHKENWIDFESEISNVIQRIDSDMHRLSNDCNLGDEFEETFDRVFKSKLRDLHMSYEKLSNVMDESLNDLIRAFEIYLCAFVSKINIMKISLDIKELSVDKIMSFNYTDTYEKIYDKKESAKYSYIHGKAKHIYSKDDKNNMVLGIDEYLTKERRNKETEFITFKKYYQRIYKGTGCEYKDWIYEIKESCKSLESKLRAEYPVQIPFEKFTSDAKHNLYIFGHSLDVTDKDILRELILNDNVKTKIFYPDKKDLGKKIANLVKVIGQDELTRRTGGSTKTIEFKLQQDMVERV